MEIEASEQHLKNVMLGLAGTLFDIILLDSKEAIDTYCIENIEKILEEYRTEYEEDIFYKRNLKLLNYIKGEDEKPTT